MLLEVIQSFLMVLAIVMIVLVTFSRVIMISRQPQIRSKRDKNLLKQTHVVTARPDLSNIRYQVEQITDKDYSDLR